jgi:hypothetical protein
VIFFHKNIIKYTRMTPVMYRCEKGLPDCEKDFKKFYDFVCEIVSRNNWNNPFFTNVVRDCAWNANDATSN